MPNWFHFNLREFSHGVEWLFFCALPCFIGYCRVLGSALRGVRKVITDGEKLSAVLPFKKIYA